MMRAILAGTSVAVLLFSLPAALVADETPAKPQNTAATTAASDDPYLWLEDINGERPLQWVKKENARTAERFAGTGEFEQMRRQLLEVLDSEDRIPMISRRGAYLYNFWQDQEHPRGVWRRTTLEQYRDPKPHWEVLLDIDHLNATEGKKWVFKGAECLKPDFDRCLVLLSPGGGDAVEVREFDVPGKAFVDDGFHLPVAKTSVSWIDRDSIFVGTDFGPGSMTESSYPRIAKRWHRGTPLSEADVVYEGKNTDLGVFAQHDDTPGFERDLVIVAKDIFHFDYFQLIGDDLVRVPVPDDSQATPYRQWLLVELRSDWEVGGRKFPAGALLAAPLQDVVQGKPDFEALFEPDEHSALQSWSPTRHHLILNILDDVKSRLEVLTPSAQGWQREALEGAPGMSKIGVVDTDPDNSDEYWLSVTGYLTPPSLQRGVLGGEPAETLKQEPAFFDASNYAVTQHFVASQDGTRIPYFEVAPKGLEPDGTHHTLLYGYGGFEVSMLPNYSGMVGRAWLARGGVFVVANIRGGGEYGPPWHKAALKANRPRAYEDFAAVARDLVKRGVTTPDRLGAMGGSNGGLLVGNMLTEYPQLFGAIVCEVPLLDMKRYTHLSAGASWIAEYGDPDDPEQWKYIKTFSPYQNVEQGREYPPVLFYTTTSDDRVGPVQARKMAAKMQGMGYPNVWFYENLEGGHGSGAENKQSAYMWAMAYTFLWDTLKEPEGH